MAEGAKTRLALTGSAASRLDDQPEPLATVQKFRISASESPPPANCAVLARRDHNSDTPVSGGFSGPEIALSEVPRRLRASDGQPGSDPLGSRTLARKPTTASTARPHTPTPPAPRTAWRRCGRACLRGREESCRNLLLPHRA